MKNKIYLDYAATTPVDPAVFRAMKPYFSEKFGNAGSLHSFGQEAIAAVDKSRETIANAIGAEFRDIIFTGSATEANNSALRGAVRDGRRETGNEKSRIVISAIEHESVLETARDLEKNGVEVIYIPVDKNGVINLKKLKESLNENTVLVSVMYVNNEIGTVQPIAEISKIIKEFGEQKIKMGPRLREDDGKKEFSSPLSALRSPLLHCDASQAFNYFDCDVNTLGVDMMTLSSHKIYGPKGAAALYVRGNFQLPISNFQTSKIISPLIVGGGQEFGLRSGTENVPAIVGFAKAVQMAIPLREKEFKRIAVLREFFWNGIKKIYPQAEINGKFPISNFQFPNMDAASPHILNVYFPGHDAQDILTRLDLAGVAASSGSACRSRAMESSYVIEALGYAKQRALSSVRFSFGRQTTKGELAQTLKILKKIL